MINPLLMVFKLFEKGQIGVYSDCVVSLLDIAKKLNGSDSTIECKKTGNHRQNKVVAANRKSLCLKIQHFLEQ